MNYLKQIAWAVTLGAMSLAAPSVYAQSGGHPEGAHRMLSPGDLKWVDVPSLPPGAKLAVIEGPLNEAVPFTFRLQLPANYQIPAHWHAAVERVTVISGTLNMGVGDKLERSKTKPLGPGSMAIMQPKTNHFVWTKEETVVQLNGTGPWTITYVNPTDDPRKN
jgi:anti-sigma factor ChrR (cupin superfamily)